MSILRSALCAACLVLFIPAGTPRAQSPPTASDEVLTRLDSTLRELLELLKQHMDRQQVELMMKRVEMRSRTLEQQERELRDARSEKRGVTEELRFLEAMREQLEASPEKEDDPESRRTKVEHELRLRLIKERQWTIDQRILDLEQDLSDRSRILRMWEERIDDALGLR